MGGTGDLLLASGHSEPVLAELEMQVRTLPWVDDLAAPVAVRFPAPSFASEA